MITRLNFTDRIQLEDAQVFGEISCSHNETKLKVHWDLRGSSSLSGDDELVLDIYDIGSTRTIRHKLGNYLNGQDSSNDIDLSLFSNVTSVRLRFKVVRIVKEKRVIVANLDHFRPVLPPELESSESLLPMDSDLTMEIPWDVRFVDSEPVLFISGKYNLWEQLRNKSKSGWFSPLVLHVVVEQIFLWLCDPLKPKTSSLQRDWERFFFELKCPRNFFDELYAAEEESRLLMIENQVSSIVDQFSRHHRLLELLNAYDLQEGAQI